jgi:hypothetical protein
MLRPGDAKFRAALAGEEDRYSLLNSPRGEDNGRTGENEEKLTGRLPPFG